MRNFIKKDKVTIITVVIFFVLFFFSLYYVIQIFRSNAVYAYDVSQRTDSLTYQNISLPIGVYQIEMDYQTDTSNAVLCTVKDSTVFTGGLQTNGEFLQVGKGRTNFLMWLFESTHSLEIYLTFLEDHFAEAGNLIIYETDELWTMLLATTLFLMFILLGLAYMRYYDHKYGIGAERKKVIFTIGLITFLVSLPNLLGTNIGGADLTYHLHRIDGVAQGLRNGQFPVRIYPEWPHGYGYADGVMYGNTLLLFPALLRLLGFTVTTSYNLFCIALNLATSWIAYFCFSRIWKDRTIGLICSALYTLSIIRINRLVITAALGDGCALTFLPLILYGFYQIFTQKPKSRSYGRLWIPLALGYGGLIQTHVLTCEITIFVTVVACLYYWKKVFRKETFLILAKGAVGALVISLWFIVPFLDYFLHENLHVTNVSGRTIQERGLYIAQLAFHWWGDGDNLNLSTIGAQYSDAMGVGMIFMLGFTVIFVLWFSGKWKVGKGIDPTSGNAIISLGKFSFLIGGLLMLMSLSVFPWDSIQKLGGPVASLVSSLQFPKRFLGWATLFLVAIYGCCLWLFQQKKQQWYYYIGIVLTFLALATSSLYLLDYVTAGEGQIIIYNEEGMGMGYLSGAEYLVEGTNQDSLQYRMPTSGEGIVTQDYQRKGLTSRLSCVNSSGQYGYVDLPVLLYTGYRAWDQSTQKELTVMSGENHCVRILIPPGFHSEIILRFVPPISWRLAEIGSYLGWILLLSWGVIYLKAKRKEGSLDANHFVKV
jgi:hypothetical protein